MPYITTERVSEIRKEIRKLFPAYKFSITKDGATVYVAILSGPLDLLLPDYQERGYTQVNKWNIKENYNHNPAIAELLTTISAIMNIGNRTITVDSDYGNIPAFYTQLSIGQWDKPFVCTTGLEPAPKVKREPKEKKPAAPKKEYSTIYYNSPFGVARIEAELVDFGTKKHAQYPNATYAHYIPKGKRKITGFINGFNPYMVILKGIDTPKPESAFKPVVISGQVRTSQSKYSSYDVRYKTDFDLVLNQYIAANPDSVLMDYRHTECTELLTRGKAAPEPQAAPGVPMAR